MKVGTLIIVSLTALVHYNGANPGKENQEVTPASTSYANNKELVSRCYYGLKQKKHGLILDFSRSIHKRCGGGRIVHKETAPGKRHLSLDQRETSPDGGGAGHDKRDKKQDSDGLDQKETNAGDKKWGLTKRNKETSHSPLEKKEKKSNVFFNDQPQIPGHPFGKRCGGKVVQKETLLGHPFGKRCGGGKIVQKETLLGHPFGKRCGGGGLMQKENVPGNDWGLDNRDEMSGRGEQKTDGYTLDFSRSIDKRCGGGRVETGPDEKEWGLDKRVKITRRGYGYDQALDFIHGFGKRSGYGTKKQKETVLKERHVSNVGTRGAKLQKETGAAERQ